MDVSNGANIFYTIMSAITPIAVAILGVMQSKRNKSDRKYRKLREENEKLQHEKELEKARESEERLSSMENNISDLTSAVTELRKDVDIQKIEKQLNCLHTLNSFNFEYIQSLSSVVITIGDTITAMDSLDDNARLKLQSEIKTHKSREQEITKKLYTVIM